MPLSAADIVSLSRLIDQALALDLRDREAWLAALPAADRVHRDRLREMLAQAADPDNDQHLAALPQLDSDGTVARSGDSVGPYRLLHEIGRGGMGTVWLAERADGAYRRQVALKLPRLAWGTGLAARMARERDIGALLEHPNIARLYDAGVDARGRPFLALEFVDGQPIDAWCEAQALDVRARLRLFVQVARAVAYAHGRLVVHRDLKPSNVLVTPDGQAHLLDFGIARLLSDAAPPGAAGLTEEQGRVLTPHYASPEQVAGEAITVQSDVYSLGVLLYELLTGALPIAPRRGSLGAVEDAILAGDAPPASSRVPDRATARALRGEVDAILAKAMQREPQRRYATADALAVDIERHLHGETVAARPDSLAYRARKALRRHWLGISAAAAVLVAVLGGSGVAVLQAQRAGLAAERERVVKAFVADVFRVNSGVDPQEAAQRPASTQALLEGGARLIQQRFAGQPGLQAELYEVVGGVFSDMGAYGLAADYAERRVEALQTVPAGPGEQARGLLALSQALFDARRYGDAEPRIRQALALAGSETPLHLDALVLLARTQSAESRIDALQASLQEIDRRLAARGSAASTAGAWALALRAGLLSLRNQADDAVGFERQAIALAEASEGPLSLTAASIRLDLADRLAGTAFSAQAAEQFDAASRTLRRLGGAHEVRVALAGAMFALRRFASSGQISADEALVQIARSRADLAATRLPIPPWFIPQVDFARGCVLTDQGNFREGWPLLEAAAPELRKAAVTVAERSALAYRLGKAAMVAGRHGLADGLLRERVALLRAEGLELHPWTVWSHVVVAKNLWMQGQTAAADQALDKAPRSVAPRGDGFNGDQPRRVLVRARAAVRLHAGQPLQALRILEDALPAADDFADHKSEYHRLHGEALCAAGRQREGLAALQPEVVSAAQSDEDPHAPLNARLHAVAGLCALGLGDRSAARRHAAQARAAFTAQPQVSPFYKAPLFRLERALGLQLPPV